MDIQSALKSQYHAALKSLRLAIEQCPDAKWDDPADAFSRFWRVAYHALYFTHFYLQKDQNSFTPWSRHRDEAQFIGALPWENNRPPKPCDTYTRADLLQYWHECDAMVDAAVDALDLSAPQCGFPWYRMGTLEHQLMNIRHTQHHAGALASRLRRESKVNVEWIGKV